jgi:hypothetical protein
VRGYPTTTQAARPQKKPREISQAKDDDNDERIASRLLKIIAISSVIGLGALAWGSYKLYTHRGKPFSLIASAYRV